MADHPEFRRVAVIGVGLIGGSFGMALRNRGLAEEVVGVGRNEGRLQSAVNLGAVDSWTLDTEEGVTGADLVYIATPVGMVLDFITRALPFVDSDCLITDAGSTKAEICRRADELVGDRAMFVGGHPMAGSEESGVEAAREGLFEGTTYVLTSTSATNPEAVERMRRVVERVGARVVLMEPDEHDRCVAVISHFPHVMAAALALLAQQESESDPHLFDLAAGSFRDMTRVAGSPSVLWRDICLSNAVAVGEAAGEFRRLVDQAIELMQAGDAKSLEDWFSAAKAVRDSVYGVESRKSKVEDPCPDKSASQ